MINKIENPELDSLVHCFKVPQQSIVFGNLSDCNEYDIADMESLKSLFEKPLDHAAFLFLIEKEKSDTLFKKLSSSDYMKSVDENELQAMVAKYEGDNKDLVILLETGKGKHTKEYLAAKDNFNHPYYFVQYFFSTEERMDGTDEEFFDSIDNNHELLEFLNGILEQ